MKRNNHFNQIFWGLVIIAVGLLFLAQNLGYQVGFQFWRYLPGLLILLGIYQLFINQWRAWVGPIIMILIGGYLLSATLGFIAWGTFGNLIWPTVLILVGLSIIFRHGIAGSNSSEESGSNFNAFSAFSDQKKMITTQDFQNGELTTIFGALKIDLNQAAVVNAPAHLQTTTLFGGIEIYIPADWNVHLNVVALFGGSEDKRKTGISAKSTPDLIVSGTVLFGGLEIK